MPPDRALRRAVVVTVAAVVIATVALLWAAIGRQDGTVATTQPPGTPPAPFDSQVPDANSRQNTPRGDPSSAIAVVPGQSENTGGGSGDPSADGSSASTSTSSTTSTTVTRSRPVHRPSLDGDIDGDGRTDRVTLVPVGSTVQVFAMLTTVGPQEVTVQARAPKLVGVVDMNGDGFAEILLRADRQGFDEDGVWGAAITLVDDRLTEVMRATGGAWRFPVSSSSGLECRDVDSSPDSEVITTEAESSGTGGNRFETYSQPTMTRQIHRLVGSMVERVGEPEQVDGTPEVACRSLPPASSWSN